MPFSVTSSTGCEVAVPYTIKESRRAKHVRLRVLPTGNLEVVIPVGYDARRIPEIVRNKQGWIDRTLEKLKSNHNQTIEQPSLPSEIHLASIGELWHVEYYATSAAKVSVLERRGRVLAVRGAIELQDGCREALRRWLTHTAYIHLLPWLTKVSQQCGLPFQKATVRGQKTLWASCSCQHAISLNHKLLFLPPPLVHYIFVHELCHTRHLNHSADFWRLVGEKLPDYRHWDREIRQANRYVPLWALHDR